ncbi:MAG: hypothetical protein SPI44_03060 [Bacilli bacterium]|nr:hypothetical protein [Bacilli bacterium]
MDKAEKINIGKIILDDETNKKFLDFDNNRDMFCSGNKEDYYCKIYDYVRKIVYKSRNAGEMILNKFFVSNIIRILKDDILIVNKLKEMGYLELLHYLITYQDIINIIKLGEYWPYSEEDSNIRKEAVELLENQNKEIEDFLKLIDYDNKIKELLEKFKVYIKSEGELREDIFLELDLIFTTAHNIPKEYVDLYIKNIIYYNKVPSLEAFRNAITSLISNYAKEHGTFCYTEICKLDFGTLGSYDNHVISISSSNFNLFFLGQLSKKQDLFDTIFHELTHLLQEKNYKSDFLSYDYILMLKDFLLTSTIEESYLKKNYMSLTPEVDARKNGHIETDNYFLSLGIMPRTNTLKKIMLDKKRNGNDYRYLNGKEYTVDTLFDEKILQIIDVLKNEYKVNIFEEYPIMKLMFHEDGRRKTTLELLKERETTKDIQTISQIDEILARRKISKENCIKDLEELILDNTLSIDKTEYIRRLNLLLKAKERKKLLAKLKSISLSLKDLSRNFLIFLGELEEIEAIINDERIDMILSKRENKKQKIDKL